VLVAFGLQQSVFPVRIGEILLLVIALSMLLTPLAFIASDWIARRLAHEAKPEDGEADEIEEKARSSSRASAASGRWSTGWCRPRASRRWCSTTTSPRSS
jgi:hypothetical protein